MTEGFGHDVLCVFDVWEDSREFLSQIIDSGTAPPQETRWLFEQSLIGGADDWFYLIDCAKSIQRARHHDEGSLDGTDALTYVWHIFEGAYLDDSPLPWGETDRLIELAKQLEQDPSTKSPSPITSRQSRSKRRSVPSSNEERRCLAVSHYWSTDTASDRKENANNVQSYPRASVFHSHLAQLRGEATWCRDTTKEYLGIGASSHRPTSKATTKALDHNQPSGGPDTFEPSAVPWEKVAGPKQSGISPYFSFPSDPPKQPSPKKPPRGTVSCVPFPSLAAHSFGLVQEKVAHEPFWLLVAITFLIRTAGKQAIPVFYRVKERFPTPSQIVDPANEGELLDMIRHLGLSAVRVAYLRRYAKAFLENPPAPGIGYRVKNYGQRDMMPLQKMNNDSLEDSNTSSQEPAVDGEDAEAWEVGHMTKGKYAIDSWRIFCRDELLGRALDWNGKGREPEFQPEWMRVMPDDKELRAYLRWMWMREGWEWDPATGERTVLRDEMQRAVNEGRVEYDETGGLRILDEPRQA